MYKLVLISFDIRICLFCKRVSNGFVVYYVNILLKENTKENMSKIHRDLCLKRLTLWIRGILESKIFKGYILHYSIFCYKSWKNMLIFTILIIINDFRGTIVWPPSWKQRVLKAALKRSSSDIYSLLTDLVLILKHYIS